MMKKFKKMISILAAIALLLPTAAYAREGDCGYEGGISSGESPGKTTFDYQEVCFITGEPVVLKGTLTLKKSVKADKITASYKYDLKNIDKSATLARTISFDTKLTKKDNGQTVEETVLSGKSSEVFKIGKDTYTMKNYDFTRSNLLDVRPAINYFAGNTWGKKTYTYTTSGTSTATGTVTVEATGDFYGYDQYWGTAEAIVTDYVIQSEQKKGEDFEKWGGTARVTLSSTTAKKLRYVENEPNNMSFSGGYLQTQYNDNILEYTCRLPEFDSLGNSTDNMIMTNDSLKLESSPVQTRLTVPDMSQIKGHWAENEIKILYALEVFKNIDSSFDPDRYVSRSEFTAEVLNAAKEVPPDPAATGKKTTAATTATTRNTRTKNKVVSPFSDVETDDEYFEQINSAYKRGLINGNGFSSFGPEEKITIADALTILIRAVGLEGIAPGPKAVTSFRDNDSIPEYARNAVYVADRIGLVKADDNGNLNPDEPITRAASATLLKKFVDYLREDIRRDYREHIINY